MLLYHTIASYGNGIGAGTAALSILIYDFFAFVTELPLGALLDRQKKIPWKASNINGLIAASGCLVIAVIDLTAAFDLIPATLLIPTAVVTGLANAAFHLGAGIDVIIMSEKKTSFSGIFISTGALGLFLGTNALSMQYDHLLIPAILLFSVSLYILWQYFHETMSMVNADSAIIHTKHGFLFLALSLLFLVIMYRSFLGFASKYSWRSGFLIGFAAVTAVFFGKFSGGIAADRFGWKPTILVSLLTCSILAVFSDTSPLAGCIVLFLFNTTMSIAMMGLANILTQWKGVAFGLNTTALFLGFIICHMIDIPISGLVFCIMILLSAIVLMAALRIAPEMEG